MCAVTTNVFARFSLGEGWESREKLCEVRILSIFSFVEASNPVTGAAGSSFFLLWGLEHLSYII